MPNDPRFGPMCRRLIDDHDLLSILPVGESEAPEGQLWKPAQTPEEAREKLSEFLEALFEAAADLAGTA